MIACFHCGRSLLGRKQVSTRKWCSVKCRNESRRERARDRFADWLRLELPDKPPDLELLLLQIAPDGAWWYRLRCPGLRNGAPRYFPGGDAWCMRPHEPPAVPWSGVYSVCFYGEHLDLLGVCDGAAVVLASGVTHPPCRQPQTRSDIARARRSACAQRAHRPYTRDG